MVEKEVFHEVLKAFIRVGRVTRGVTGDMGAGTYLSEPPKMAKLPEFFFRLWVSFKLLESETTQ